MADELVKVGAAEQPRAQQATGTIISLGRTLASVLDVGRDLLARRRTGGAPQPQTAAALAALCRELLEHRGEASGLALASEVATGYQQLPDAQRLDFFTALANDFDVDSAAILAAADRYRENHALENLLAIHHAVEAPRQKLFRRINMAPHGTRTLVAMRGHLLQVLADNPQYRGIDSDLKHLFVSWFNKGFLTLRRIDWSSPASILEKIIDYEAVHEINGWDDLRSRLRDDRRCFAFFHPAMADDPLVFVEVALTDQVPGSMGPLLLQDREPLPTGKVNTVVFYSISNCHPGLAGVSFGNFLIKTVVEEMQKEIPALKTFVTLSPVPGFRRWLRHADLGKLLPEDMAAKVREPVGRVVDAQVYDALLRLCAHYLVKVKAGQQPLDPVARFHLGNGAQLYRIHPSADLSAKGLQQSAGIMVNYLYDLARIEENHDTYFQQGRVATSKAVNRLLEQK